VYGMANYSPSGLLMQVVAARNAGVMRPPRRLDAYASPGHDGSGAYVSTIEAGSYEPGEYIVDVSPSDDFKARCTVSKKFTVIPSRPIARSAGMARRR